MNNHPTAVSSAIWGKTVFSRDKALILLAIKNTPFMARIFSPIAALQKLDVAPLCLRFWALLSTKIHAP